MALPDRMKIIDDTPKLKLQTQKRWDAKSLPLTDLRQNSVPLRSQKQSEICKQKIYNFALAPPKLLKFATEKWDNETLDFKEKRKNYIY